MAKYGLFGALSLGICAAVCAAPANAGNQRPAAADDGGFSTPSNTSLRIPAAHLLRNDVDPDGHPLRIASVGGAVKGTVAAGPDGMITFTPSRGATGGASFRYTALDEAGGASTATVRLTIASTSLSFWNSAVTPKIVTEADRNPVELGFKFYSDVAGQVLGIRFYKGPQNTGTHTVSLWTLTGTLLASAASADETASGWQQVLFPKPVAINAKQQYVASYHTTGFYSTDHNYFSTGANSGSLHALASGAAGGNGVYKYSSSPTFPNQSWQASNYWVDVVVSPQVAVDTQPPTTPGGLLAVAATGQIALSWTASTDNKGVVHYEIKRSGAVLTTTDGVSYLNSGLPPATAYTYGVTAFDDAGNRSATVTATATTPNTGQPACSVGLGAGAGLAGNLPFPGDNAWNLDVSTAAVDPNSASILSTTNLGTSLHPDFGSGLYAGTAIGIPYIVVAETQPLVPIAFTAWPGESDPGPYPFPPNAPIEGLGATDYNDRHVLVVQRDCTKPNRLGKLFETFGTWPVGNYPTSVTSWEAKNGAVFDLNSNGSRPAGWTSADAAGLPIFPGLVRYDEVAAGEIRHALRFTLAPGYTRKAYVHPARHWASSNTGSQYAPFGMRVRLKANVDITGFPPVVQVIARALKRYGMLMADNGGNWFVSGAPDPRWNNDDLRWLGYLKAGDFEVVRMGTIVTP